MTRWPFYASPCTGHIARCTPCPLCDTPWRVGNAFAHPIPPPPVRSATHPLHQLRWRRHARWSRFSTRPWTGRSRRLAFTTAAVDEIRTDFAPFNSCPIIDFFEPNMAQVESILQARGERVLLTAPWGRRHQALQRSDGRCRVRHRARRRAESAGSGQSRRDPRRAVPMRQDAHNHVSGAATRHLRRQLSTGRRGPCSDTAAPAHLRRCATGATAIVTTPARLSTGPARAPPQLHLRLPRAVLVGAVPPGGGGPVPGYSYVLLTRRSKASRSVSRRFR